MMSNAFMVFILLGLGMAFVGNVILVFLNDTGMRPMGVRVRGGMWGKKKPYGMLRWELLDFLIETLDKRFAENP